MKNLLVIPNHIDMIEHTKNNCDGYLLGLKDFSVNLPLSFTYQQLRLYVSMLKQEKKKVFVVINKNIHHEELEELTTYLKQLDQLSIDGILYYDIALVQLKKKYQFSFDLVWFQEQLVTNAVTCNYWSQFGVSYAYLSPTLNLQEIKEIREETKMGLMVTVFGYLPMFVSKRHLIDNYLSFFQLSGKEEMHYIEKEGYRYPIVDEKLGTTVYSSYPLSALEEMMQMSHDQIDYFVLNSFGIEENLFEQILNCYYEIEEENKEQCIQRLNTLLDHHYDKGFLYKETVYKVK